MKASAPRSYSGILLVGLVAALGVRSLQEATKDE